jgi:hypothetical protein
MSLILNRALTALRLRIVPLERVVERLAGSSRPPHLMHYGGGKGFRYGNPGVRHFCLGKAVRLVSGLNACIELARSGYTQEIAIVGRTIIECATHIEFVLDLNDTQKHKKLVKEYVEGFFADSKRGPGAPVKKAQVPQGVVSDTLGQSLDEVAEAVGKGEGRTPAATLYRQVYQTYSNYVHAKYPECMDLYGSTPGHFHLRGMSNTPKDEENIEQIASQIETACNTFVIMVQQLDLLDLVRQDEVLHVWYRARVE